MGTLKRIASTGCDWKESFDKDDHDQLYKAVNDPESESMELIVWTGDFKILARGPLSFFDNLPKDIGDWLYDYDHENIYWDEEIKEIRVFWKGNFITQEAWNVVINAYYEDDEDREDEFLKDVEKNLIPTEKDFDDYPDPKIIKTGDTVIVKRNKLGVKAGIEGTVYRLYPKNLCDLKTRDGIYGKFPIRALRKPKTK